jgi:hypothetical protein
MGIPLFPSLLPSFFFSFVCFMLTHHVVMEFSKFDTLHVFKTFVILGKNFMEHFAHKLSTGLFTYFSSFQSLREPLCKFATCLQRHTLTIYDKVCKWTHLQSGVWILKPIMRPEVWVVKFLGPPPPSPTPLARSPSALTRSTKAFKIIGKWYTFISSWWASMGWAMSGYL